MASLSAQDAELILNLVRYEHDNPGYVRNHWDKHVIRPFLTPASGVEFEDDKDEAVLPHAHFTEIIRKTDITEQAYRPSKGEEESITTTYYSHIGIMPDTLHGGYILFANWDIFLGQYFLTTGKANERLVEGTSRNGKGVKDGKTQEEKLIESFRNFAPTLYRVLTDKDSAVKAFPRLKIGEETLNVWPLWPRTSTVPKNDWPPLASKSVKKSTRPHIWPSGAGICRLCGCINRT